MTYTVAGFVGGALAGAWLGFLVEWMSASGGWDEMHRDEMHLGFAVARGTLLFVLAGGITLPWRPVRLTGRFLPLVLVSTLGSVFFVLAVFVPDAVEYRRQFPETSQAGVVGCHIGARGSVALLCRAGVRDHARHRPNRAAGRSCDRLGRSPEHSGVSRCTAWVRISVSSVDTPAKGVSCDT